MGSMYLAEWGLIWLRVYGNVKEIHDIAEQVRGHKQCGFFIEITRRDAFIEIFDFGKPAAAQKNEFTISGMTTDANEVIRVRSEYIAQRELGHLLAALMPHNRLALEVSLSTGLRISDVLSIKTQQLHDSKDGRLRIREMKTGKYRRVYISKDLFERMLKLSGKIYVFEHRLDRYKHRTRQAVFKDLRRVADAFRIKEHISPHSCRKVYAVNFYHRCGEDLSRVQKLLNHENEAVTMLYALADVLYNRTYSKAKKGTVRKKNKCSY